jgi:hypothetical protein
MQPIISKPSGVQPGKLEATLKQLDAGTLKDIPAKSNITVEGTAMTPAQIDKQIQGYLTTIDAVAPAKQAYQTAVATRMGITVEAQDFCNSLKTAVITLLGKQSAQLADFGIKPAKAETTTTAAAMVASAKRTLTRQLRGTTSKKQKLSLKAGVVNPAVTVGTDGKVSIASATAAPASGSSPTSTSSTPAAGSAASTSTSTSGASSSTGTPAA